MSAVRAQPVNVIHREGREYRAFFLRGRMRSGTNWGCNLLNRNTEAGLIEAS